MRNGSCRPLRNRAKVATQGLIWFSAQSRGTIRCGVPLEWRLRNSIVMRFITSELLADYLRGRRIPQLKIRWIPLLARFQSFWPVGERAAHVRPPFRHQEFCLLRQSSFSHRQPPYFGGFYRKENNDHSLLIVVFLSLRNVIRGVISLVKR